MSQQLAILSKGKELPSAIRLYNLAEGQIVRGSVSGVWYMGTYTKGALIRFCSTGLYPTVTTATIKPDDLSRGVPEPSGFVFSLTLTQE